MEQFYRGRAVLITGGLGFVGSNLAIRLVQLGAKVTIVDSLVRGCGGNAENIVPVGSQIRVIEADIAEASAFRSVLAESKTIFNLAGEVSHIHSVEFPARDLRINALSQMEFLMECADAAPGVRVVYAGTRQIYGVPRYLPVDEAHPIDPVDFNGVHKYAAAQYHAMLTRSGKLDAIVLRLSNVYGPRMAVNVPCQGFLPFFFRKLLRGEPIEVFGNGRQVRDPLHVDDAVESFLLAGRFGELPSRVYNIGGPTVMPLHEIATIICDAAGISPPVQSVFPEALKKIDIGGYASDSRLARTQLNWSPRIFFREGVSSTLAHFGLNWRHYQEAAKSAGCLLHPNEQSLHRAAAV